MAFKVEETSPRHRKGAAVAAAAPVPAIPAEGPVAAGRIYGLRDIADAFRDRVFLRYCLVSLLLYTVMAQLISTLSVYAVEWAGLTKVQLGVLYALNGLMVVFLQFPVVRLIGRMRLTSALALGTVFYGVGYGMMGLGRGFTLLAAGMFVTTMGEIVATPPSLNLVATFERIDSRRTGVRLFNSFTGRSAGRRGAPRRLLRKANVSLGVRSRGSYAWRRSLSRRPAPDRPRNRSKHGSARRARRGGVIAMERRER